MADNPKATNPVNAMVSGEERERGDKDMVEKRARTVSARLVPKFFLLEGIYGNQDGME